MPGSSLNPIPEENTLPPWSTIAWIALVIVAKIIVATEAEI